MKSVAIIGGGITGLTAAFRLKEAGVAVTLYEAGNRVGGVIQTVRRNGYLAECGPNTLLETSPKIAELIRDLGLEGRRLDSDPAAENRFLVRDGQLVSLPSTLFQFLGTRLFSTSAKLRLFAEPFLPPAPAEGEESVQDFVVRRLGREFLDYAVNPLVRGVYAGDPARLSVQQAFPKLHAVEQKYRSLILGQILGARERRRRKEVSKQNAKKLSFDHGLQVLTDELGSRLAAAVQLRAPVQQMRRVPGGGWEVTALAAAGETTRIYDAVVFTGTADKLATLHLTGVEAPDLRPLSEVYYPPVASVVLGFRREDVDHPLNGFGALIPEVEKFNILGTIFSSSLFPNRAPAGHVLLTSYVGGARSPETAQQDPEKLTALVLQDLKKLVGVTGVPTFQHHCFYPRAIPQYVVGYDRFKQLMRCVEEKCPGFFLAGHYRDGISLGDSIVAGHTAAGRVRDCLSTACASVPVPELNLEPAV